jgi:hypothetical protein
MNVRAQSGSVIVWRPRNLVTMTTSSRQSSPRSRVDRVTKETVTRVARANNIGHCRPQVKAHTNVHVALLGITGVDDRVFGSSDC